MDILSLLWLIPAIPFGAFLFLVFFGKRISGKAVAAAGVGSVAISMLLSLVLAAVFLIPPRADFVYSQHLWTWMRIGPFSPSLGLHLDGLSLIMITVISAAAFLILLYSVGFMAGDDGYSRFFAYMNLFVGSMLLLVLADNLIFLYFGWEGVGLCSYLLIGFWYREPDNGKAAIKAFLVTRIGDTSLAVGLFLLFVNLGTLDIPELSRRAMETWPAGSMIASAAALLLLGGAIGKSAQMPLQVWLPDAMAGPTPVSALIHAATMVTAGVYLIARMHPLFVLAPGVQFLTALVGAVTLIVAAASALAQSDIKRILAYSTMSQIGYMFLGLGAGAWPAAIFHFMTHAFFKALLFLSAGVVIKATGEEHDISRMGGLRTALPLAFWPFLAGAASLSAVPLITAGFYSKEAVLFEVWSSAAAGPWLWLAGLTGTFLTSVYIFRAVFLVFLGRQKARGEWRPSPAVTVSLVVLSILALAAGFLRAPLAFLLPAPAIYVSSPIGGLLQLAASVTSVAGILLAFLLYVAFPASAGSLARIPVIAAIRDFWLSGWSFDRAYGALFVKPFVRLSAVNKGDVVDLVYRGLAGVATSGHYALSFTQSGKVRWYAVGIGLGALVFVGVAVFSWH